MTWTRSIEGTKLQDGTICIFMGVGRVWGPVFSIARFSCLRDGLLPSIIAMVVTKADLLWVAERAIRLVGVGWE